MLGRLLLAIVLFFLLRKVLTWAFDGLSSLSGSKKPQAKEAGPEADPGDLGAAELSDQRIEEADFEELP